MSQEFFEITFGNILSWIISVFAIIAAAWRIIDWQKKREEKEREEKEKKELEKAAELKKYADERNKVVLDKISEVDKKVTTQLQRQNRRSDFTNSNVRKVRIDTLELQIQIHSIKKALLEKKIVEPEDYTDRFFEREISKKRAEIEADEREQQPEFNG